MNNTSSIPKKFVVELNPVIFVVIVVMALTICFCCKKCYGISSADGSADGSAKVEV